MTFTRRIRSVYIKELLDILRDHRTLMAMLVLPIVLYPFLVVLFANAAGGQAAQIAEEPIVVGTRSLTDRERLRSLIEEDYLYLRREQGLPPPASGTPLHEQAQQPQGTLADSRYADQTSDSLELLIRNREIDVGVEFLSEDAERSGDGPVRIRLYVLDEYIRSRLAANRIESMITRMNQRLRPDPLSVSEVRLTTPSSILSMILPLILILMTITCAIYPAIDLTAGERERGTLESLMVCPVPVRDLIVGKFLVVTTVAVVGAALNLASVSATVYFGGFKDLIQTADIQRADAPDPAGSEGTILKEGSSENNALSEDADPRQAGKRSNTGFPFLVLPVILITLIPFAVLMSAIMIAVSSCARTFKEAQNYVTPVILGVLLPGGIAALPGTELRGSMLVMPVANMVLLTRDLLRGAGAVPGSALAWVLISTSLYAAAAVGLATKVFGTESVVFADSGSWRTLLLRRWMQPSKRPSTSFMTLLMALLLPLWFYVQTGLTSQGAENVTKLLHGTALLMPLFFVIVPVLILAYRKVNIVESLALRIPAPRYWAAALLLGVSSWIPTHEMYVLLTEWLGTPQDVAQFNELLEGALKAMPPLMVILYIAVIPAISEELLFRGMGLSSLRGRVKQWTAIVIVAAVFAAFHMSFFRFPITFPLGLAFGWLCWQSRSVWPAIVAHGLHNGVGALSVVRPDWQSSFITSAPEGHLPWIWIAVGLALPLTALLLAVGGSDSSPDEKAARRDP